MLRGCFRKKWMVATGVLLVFGFLAYAAVQSKVGEPLDSYRGVSVYDNGLVVAQSHGRHYAKDGYYYGKKWQCVEFVKRFYHQAYNHSMPYVMGHARDFWDQETAHRGVNVRRGLVQYWNGGDVYPKTGDLVVFTNGFYGHVAIICAVTTNDVQVIQQNVAGSPRTTLPLVWTTNRFQIGRGYEPAGWMRLPENLRK